MAGYKDRYDIFICGGSRHVRTLQTLLPRLYPFGNIHLASSRFSRLEAQALRHGCDVLHEPCYCQDDYENFEHFCIRDINRFATRPHFIKLDCDTLLRSDWIEYVDETLEKHGDAVLFGPEEGYSRINIELAGAFVRQKLGRDISVTDGMKLSGGFYVGQTAFFKQHDTAMRLTHELLYCFYEGERFRPSLYPSEWGEDETNLRLLESNYATWGECSEDHLRSLIVHAMGAGDRLLCADSGGKVAVSHALV